MYIICIIYAIYTYIYIYITFMRHCNLCIYIKALSMEAYSRYIKQDCKTNNLLNIAE